MTSTHATTHCQIIPPYMLQALSRAADPAVAQRAERALLADHSIRQQRTRATLTAVQSASPAPRRVISDAGQTETTPGTVVRTEGDPATGDPATDEAYDGLGATWTFFHDAYGRDSIDGAGMDLLGTVHYGRNYDNAFFDGSQMIFGDGDGTVFNRFTISVDVIGHELTHGVTSATANLTYSGQSGALNESISDVFGSCVKQMLLGQTADQADWLIGSGLLASGINGRALRDMLHPGTAYDDPQLGKDPQPDSMASFVQTSEDNGGVHLNSGIPNRAFALAATALGGSSWQVAGKIWYDVLTGSQITADCDFVTFAELTVAAAAAVSSEAEQAVRTGWTTVGVLGSSDSSSTPPATEPGVVTLRRSGGFAGVVRERRLRLSELSEHDRQAWQRLLEARHLQAYSEQPTHPDAFCYSIACPDLGIDVQVEEPHLPDDVHELLKRTLAG